MLTITKDTLIDILSLSTSNRIRVFYQTDVKMNKKENPFYCMGALTNVVEKVTESVYGFGENYVEAVRDAAAASGVQDSSFAASGKAWATTVVENKVFKNEATNTYYVRVRILKDEVPSISYLVDGLPATPEEIETIKRFERKSSSSVKKQSEFGVDEENQVRLLSLNLSKIKKVEIDGQQYLII